MVAVLSRIVYYVRLAVLGVQVLDRYVCRGALLHLHPAPHGSALASPSRAPGLPSPRPRLHGRAWEQGQVSGKGHGQGIPSAYLSPPS